MPPAHMEPWTWRAMSQNGRLTGLACTVQAPGVIHRDLNREMRGSCAAGAGTITGGALGLPSGFIAGV